MTSADNRSNHGETGYERSRVSIRDIGKSFVWFWVGLALVLGGTAAFFELLHDRATPDVPTETPRSLRPFGGRAPDGTSPRLLVSLGDSLDRIVARDRYLLSTYGISPASDSAVRIPVEAAMNILADRGLPVADPGRTLPPRMRFSESGYNPASDPNTPPIERYSYDSTAAAPRSPHSVWPRVSNSRPRLFPRPLDDGRVRILSDRGDRRHESAADEERSEPAVELPLRP